MNSWMIRSSTKAPTLRKLLKLPAQEIELSKRYPLDIASVKRLATISVYLALFYSRDGKRDEARSLVQEAIGHSDAYLAVSTGDAGLQHRLFELVACLLSDLVRSENDGLYEQCNARAIALLERLKSVPNVHVADLRQLSSYHRLRADYLLLSGQWDRARKELEQDLALVRSVPAAENTYPEIVSSEALTLAALARNLEQDLADLTARRLGWLPSIVGSSRLIPQDLSAEAWSDRVITWMRSDAAKFGLDHTRIPSIGWRMTPWFWGTLRLQREAGDLAEAQRIVDRLLALAGRLTRSYPHQAATYMLLSEAYVQRAKNAYRVDGEPVDGWERKALDAAIHAAALEPENDEAHGLVKDRRARLRKLGAK